MGATQKEHDMKAERIEKTRLLEQQSTVIEEERGISLPMPGQTNNNEETEMKSTNEGKLSFEDDLKMFDEAETRDNLLSIIVIIGIIAAIIIPIIVKVKKN